MLYCLQRPHSKVSEHHVSNPMHFRGFVTNVRMGFLSRGQYALLISFVQTTSHAAPWKGKSVDLESKPETNNAQICLLYLEANRNP